MNIDEKEKDYFGDKSVYGSTANSIDVHESDELILKGHSAHVSTCAWNPKKPVLATASADSTALIWSIPASFPTQSSTVAPQSSQSFVLQHAMDRTGHDLPKMKQDDGPYSLAWNPTGTLLATGSMNGCARVWTESGKLKHTLVTPNGPLFSLKWNGKGNLILSGSCEGTTAVWDAAAGRCVKQFKLSNEPITHVDWKDDENFASCSSDKKIYMNSMDSNTPMQTLEDHHDKISFIKFDPSGQLLASCADDCTAKIWSTKTNKVISNFYGHTRELSGVQWCPNVNRGLVLATASFDSTVKLWDVTTAKCIKTLSGHNGAIYCLSFSPYGQFLASGSSDGRVHIWSIKDGSLLKTFRGDGAIADVAWSPGGEMISAVFSSGNVVVIALRNMLGTSAIF